MGFKDPERKKAYQKEWSEKNREKRAAHQKEYQQNIKGKYATYKYGAKQRGYDFTLTEDEFETFWQKPCFYCGDPINTIGLDRIDNSIGYQLANLVSCCSICNIAKRDLSQQEFLDHIKKLYFNLYN